jgi:hypothetical protein
MFSNHSFYIFSLLIGCSDYTIQSKILNEEPGSGSASLFIESSQVKVEGLCADEVERKEIVIQNNGGRDLEILNIQLDGVNWDINHPTLPFSLFPDEKEMLIVDVGTGLGIITIESNAPESATQFIQLEGIGDSPPVLTISNPIDGETIPVDGINLQAQLDDFEDDLTSLTVDWFSSTEGFISTVPVDAEGKSQLPYIAQNYGPQEISAQVQDSCGNVGSDSVSLCQQYGYETDNLDISTWQFEGSANWNESHNYVELTTVAENIAGTAFSTATEVLANNVEIEFQFYVSGGTGADGFSLTALDTSRMTGFVGYTGGGIGYGSLPGWSIEVDTYHNGIDPTEEDHVAFSFDGQYDTPQAWANLPEMEDDQWHTMRVLVNAPHVIIEIDGVTYIDQDIPGHYSFMSYVGFTAGTGSLTNYHLIDALTVTEMICE